MGGVPASVVEYAPRGCRHVQVTVGTQLALQGVLGEASLESLGHWERGSKMPRRYDAAACVTELQTHKSISEVVRFGWRPATDGQLPSPATPKYYGYAGQTPPEPFPAKMRRSAKVDGKEA